MTVANLRHLVAKLEAQAKANRAAFRKDEDLPAYMREPWRDPRITDHALGVLSGDVRPGVFLPGLPDSLCDLATTHVGAILGAAELMGNVDNEEVRRLQAWLAAVDNGKAGSMSRIAAGVP
jgi:hypothetical protein